MTPEGKVKEKVKRELKLWGEKVPVYYHMPVQNGMGSPTVDFVCCIAGWYVAIEVKAPGKYLTLRQRITCGQIEAGGGCWFCIDDSPASWAVFDLFMKGIRERPHP